MKNNIYKLGQICDFEGGSQPPKRDFIFEQKKNYVRFIQIRDFKSNKNLTYIPISNKNRLCNEFVNWMNRNCRCMHCSYIPHVEISHDYNKKEYAGK